MARKRYTVEQIIGKLGEAEVELAKGAKTPEVCRTLGISENTYYRGRQDPNLGVDPLWWTVDRPHFKRPDPTSFRNLQAIRSPGLSDGGGGCRSPR